MSEHGEQAALFQMIRARAAQYPDLSYVYAVPNGGYRPKAVAAKMWAEGEQSGVPDIHCPLPRRGYHGLWIEMKFGGNGLSSKQSNWITRLDAEGHYALVCRSWLAAWNEIANYLGLPEEELCET